MAASENEAERDRTAERAATKAGPANPQASEDVDMPSPPGGPLRSDAPAGRVAPGGPGTPAQPGRPQEVRRPERPVEEPGPEDRSAPLLTGEDNAQSSQRQPSDDSGGQ